MTVEFGIIGGSGFYSLSSKGIKKNIKTPFGTVVVNILDINDKKVAFITRHGPKHSIPPHLVNYRANIFALHSIGVERIITSSAVGSMKEEMTPGSFVIPDQFIDFTIGRPKTFFVDNFEVDPRLLGVFCVDVPFAGDIRMVHPSEFEVSLLDRVGTRGRPNP